MPSRGAIVDLDGTVYRGDSPVPGARRGIEALQNADVETCFFSNNPTKSSVEFADRLADIGLTVAPEAIESAATVTAAYLADEHPDGRIFLVGSSGLRTQLDEAGLVLTDDPTACEVLVASYDRGFDYDDMTDGLRALDAGAAFVGTDPDVTIPTERGAVPGSGAVINAIAGVAEREPDIVVGKPSERALDTALAALDFPEDCLVVGDSLDTDVAMGERGGLTTVLVLTGSTDERTLAASEVAPDYVIGGLGDIGSVLDAER